MKTYEKETWQCPGCGLKFDYSKVKDWKCSECDDPIWIMAEVNGNNYVLERRRAKEIQKDDLILLDHMHSDNQVKSKTIWKKVRI